MISRVLAVWMLVGLLCFAPTLSAAVPTLVNHQGRLLDSSDNPVPDGPHVLTFSLYAEPDGGVPVWTETRDITTKDGLFSVMLGSVSPLDLTVFDSDSLYLQVQLSGEAPLTPRLRLGTVPAAARSGRVSGDVQTAPGQMTIGDLDGDGSLDLHSSFDQSEVSIQRKRPGRVKYSNITLRAAPDSVVDYRDTDSDDDGLSDSRLLSTLGGGGGAGGSILLEADVDGDGVAEHSISQSSRVAGASLAINSKGTSAKREMLVSTDADSASLLLSSDIDDDGIADHAVSSVCDASSARLAIQTKGTSAKRLSAGNDCDDADAVHYLDCDDDGDGVPEAYSMQVCNSDSVYHEVSILAPQGDGTVALMKAKEKANKTKCSSSLRYSSPSSSSGKDDDCDGLAASQLLFFDNDGDGEPDNQASQVVAPTTAYMAIKTKGTGADKNRTMSVTATTDGFSSAVHRCDYDDDGDGVPEQEIEDFVTPTTCSVAIKTKGTGADANRAASFSCVGDIDGDGTTDRQVHLTADSTDAGIAIDEPGVHISSRIRKGWDGTIKGSTRIDEGGTNRIMFDSDGNGYVSNALGIGVATPTHHIDVSGGAYCDGTNWVNASDRNVKENFEPVDGKELLEKISGLDITKWNYKDNNDCMKHIGPTAQDFQRVFGVGSDGKTISTIDPSGIALAAIKELYSENVSLKGQVADLMKQVESLKSQSAATDELRAQVKRLSEMVETILAARIAQDNATQLTSAH